MSNAKPTVCDTPEWLTDIQFSVLDTIRKGGIVGMKDIQKATGLSKRTIHYSLHKLVAKKHIGKKLDITDLRSILYFPLQTQNQKEES